MFATDIPQIRLDDLADVLRQSFQDALDRLGPLALPPRDLRLELVAGLQLLRTPKESGGELFGLLPGLGPLSDEIIYRLQASLSAIPGLPVPKPVFQVVPALGQIVGRVFFPIALFRML